MNLPTNLLQATTAFLAAVFFLGGVAAAQDKPAPEKVRIAIAASSLAFLVPFVAKDRGFYLKHGSDVELIQMRPNISVAALLSGEIEYIELIGSAIRSAARGLPVRAISTGIKAPFFSIIGMMRWQMRNWAKKLMAMPYCSSSSVTSRNGL